MKASLILLSELMTLALRVNEQTEKAVFLKLSGHTRSIHLRVAKGKIHDDARFGSGQDYNQNEVEVDIWSGDTDEKVLSAITHLAALIPGTTHDPSNHVFMRPSNEGVAPLYKPGEHPWDLGGVDL
jgi:hypothetical protein